MECGPNDGFTEESNSDDYTDLDLSTDEDSASGYQSDMVSDASLLAPDSIQPINKVTASMQDIMREMVIQRRLCDEHCMMLQYVAEEVDNIYDNNKAIELLEPPTDELKLFASFLHFYSPGAYEFIIAHYNTPLPSIKTLASWCENDRYQPGFTKQAFNLLQKRIAENGRRAICSLVADEHQLFVCDSDVNTDVGAGPLEYDDSNETDIQAAHVILLVSLEENWKVPLCFFMSDYNDTWTQANLIIMSLHRSHEAGVDVVSITTTADVGEKLGCELKDIKKLLTVFKHPASGNPVAVFIDPTLSLRKIYITFCSKKDFFNKQNKKICIKFIEKLKIIVANKIVVLDFSTVMLDLRNMLAKINLISELMLPSVAAALELCKNRLKIPQFAEAGPTIEYITMINTLYCILHSKAGHTGCRQPISQENAPEIFEFLEEAKKFISSISYAPATGSKKKLMAVEDPNFLARGFKHLIISVETLKHLYTTLVETGIMKCIPTHRLGWDHIDDFFGVFFKHNPRQYAGEFQPIYKRLFEDLKSNLTDGIQIESYAISNIKRALDIINKTSGKRANDEKFVVIQEKKHKTEDAKRVDTNVSNYVKQLDKEQYQMKRRQMVGYIAGWTAIQLANNLRCEDCIDAMLTNERLWFHRYITTRDLKGVCLPSEEMFLITWECERAVKGCAELDTAAQRRLLSRCLRIAQPTPRSHHVHLTRAIIAKYLRLRLGWPGY